MMQSSVIALSTIRFTRWSATSIALIMLSASGCYAPYGGYPPYGGAYGGYPGAPIQTLQPGVQPYIPGNGAVYPGSTYPSTIPTQPGSTPTYDNGGNGTLQPIPNNDPGYGGGNVKVPDPYSPAPNASSSLYPTESGIQPANHSEPSGLQPLDPYPGPLNEVRSQNPTTTAEASGMSSQAKPTQTFQPPIQAEPGFGNQPTVATPRIEAEPTYQPIPIAQPNPMADPVNSTPIPTQPFPEPTPVAQPAPIQQPMPASQPVASPFGQPTGQPIPVAQPLPMSQPPIESPFGQPTPAPVAQPAPIASPFNTEPTPAPVQPSPQAPASSEFANPFEPSAEFQPPREAEIPAPPLNNY